MVDLCIIHLLSSQFGEDSFDYPSSKSLYPGCLSLLSLVFDVVTGLFYFYIM